MIYSCVCHFGWTVAEKDEKYHHISKGIILRLDFCGENI